MVKGQEHGYVAAYCRKQQYGSSAGRVRDAMKEGFEGNIRLKRAESSSYQTLREQRIRLSERGQESDCIKLSERAEEWQNQAFRVGRERRYQDFLSGQESDGLRLLERERERQDQTFGRARERNPLESPW
ncbi:hypothetical protein XELAEV_18022234mg [Xenopus laevis]|uniref:Uncharacterized protein n=1 Tax=Xenopus laevis TaxID=8355 RepID=A0A974HN09_XENLA|nr:hypothetical protein XELAEV_18022234mg [Xenopus laevis]